MRRLATLSLLAVTAVTPAAIAQHEDAAPSYMRRRHEQHDYKRAPRRHHRVPQGPAVAAGTFQRPYPYHLDYYKQQYGGSYAPYFGNLYGPPNVVLGAPYGYYGTPYGYPSYYEEAPVESAPPAAAAFVCPHCHQPLYLVAPPVESAAVPATD